MCTTKSMLSYYENDHGDMKQSMIAEFAVILGTTVEYLVCGVIKESAPDESSAEMLRLFSSMDERTKEIMLLVVHISSASSSWVIPSLILCALILCPNVSSLIDMFIFSSFRANRKKEMYCCVRYNKQNARKDSVLPVIFSCVRGGSCPHIMKPSFSCNYA